MCLDELKYLILHLINALTDSIEEDLSKQILDDSCLIKHEIIAFVAFGIYIVFSKKLDIELVRGLVLGLLTELGEMSNNENESRAFKYAGDFKKEILNSFNYYCSIEKNAYEKVTIIDAVFGYKVYRHSYIATDGIFSHLISTIKQIPIK